MAKCVGASPSIPATIRASISRRCRCAPPPKVGFGRSTPHPESPNTATRNTLAQHECTRDAHASVRGSNGTENAGSGAELARDAAELAGAPHMLHHLPPRPRLPAPRVRAHHWLPRAVLLQVRAQLPHRPGPCAERSVTVILQACGKRFFLARHLQAVFAQRRGQLLRGEIRGGGEARALCSRRDRNATVTAAQFFRKLQRGSVFAVDAEAGDDAFERAVPAQLRVGDGVAAGRALPRFLECLFEAIAAVGMPLGTAGRWDLQHIQADLRGSRRVRARVRRAKGFPSRRLSLPVRQGARRSTIAGRCLPLAGCISSRIGYLRRAESEPRTMTARCCRFETGFRKS